MKENALTQGSIFKGLLGFSVPYMLANILQALYGSVDAMVVGQFSNAAGLSAVATGSMVMMTINCLITGLCTGGTVLIGQYWGAQQKQDVKETIGNMFVIFGIVAVALMAILLCASNLIVGLMSTPEEAVVPTLHYTRICYVGIIFTAGYNAVSAILRGMGDSKKPLIFIGVACVCNIMLDLIFVAGCGLGAAGAAIATSASQGISFFVAVIYLRSHNFVFDFKKESFKPVRDKIKRLLRLGVPLSLQDALVSVSFLFILVIINHMGVIASATAGACDKLVTFAMMPPGAFTAALATVTAQNVGANQMPRARKSFFVGMGMSLVVGIVLAAIMALFPRQLTSLFTSDPEVIAMGPLYLWPYAVESVLVCIVFSYNGFFNGCGHSTISMSAHLLSTFLVRVPVAWFLSTLPGANLAYVTAAAPISSAVQIVILFIYMRIGKWKTPKGID